MPELNQVSETAHWVASYRALEAEETSPLFIDPFAKSLAGEIGFSFLKKLPFAQKISSLFIVRTKVIDEIILELLYKQSNIKFVINIGAGLDTRPYRLAIPAYVTWIEIDQADILKFKHQALQSQQPFCSVKYLHANFSIPTSNVASAAVNPTSNSDSSSTDASTPSSKPETPINPLKNILENELAQSSYFSSGEILFITEGLLPYLNRTEILSLIDSISKTQGNRLYWISDVVKPLLVTFLGYLWNPIFKKMNYQFQTGLKNTKDFENKQFKVLKSYSLMESLISYRREPPILKFFLFTTKFWWKPIRTWYFSQSRVCLFTKDNSHSL